MNSRQKRKSKRQSQAAPAVQAEAKPVLPAAETGGAALIEPVFFKQTSGRKEDDEDIFDPVYFRRVNNKWWLDWLLPDGIYRYFGAAFVTCTLVWIGGLLLRLADNGFSNIGATVVAFAKTPEWQMQPLLLFLHFTTLRMFKGIYSRNFEKAFSHLNIPNTEVLRLRDWIFGARVNLGALLIALPFLAYKVLVYFPSDDFLLDYRITTRGPETWYLLGIWCVEWAIFGYYLYLLMAGAAITHKVLKKYHFVESVDLVLSQRQYSPLFNCTARAGTLVFFFALIQAAYVFYTGGDWGDYIGLAALGVLLMVSFGITWAAVRKTLRTGVQEAVDSLEKSYRNSRGRLSQMPEVSGIEDDVQRIQTQMKMSLALQQLEYLQTKYEQVGRKEMLGMFFRMLAPVGTAAARIIRWGSLIAALGLGGVAIIEKERKNRQQPASGNEATNPANQPAP